MFFFFLLLLLWIFIYYFFFSLICSTQESWFFNFCFIICISIINYKFYYLIWYDIQFVFFIHQHCLIWIISSIFVQIKLGFYFFFISPVNVYIIERRTKNPMVLIKTTLPAAQLLQSADQTADPAGWVDRHKATGHPQRGEDP